MHLIVQDTRWKMLCTQQDLGNWLGLIFAVHLSNFPRMASKLVYIHQKLLFQPSMCERLELFLFHSMLLKQLHLYREAIELLDATFSNSMMHIRGERDLLQELSKGTDAGQKESKV